MEQKETRTSVQTTANEQFNGQKLDPKSGGQPIVDKQKGRKRIAKPNLWQVVAKANRLFDMQVTKSSQVKQECLTKCIDAKGANAPTLWFDYRSKIERLTDSSRFKEQCETLKLKSETVAEHIVFAGFKTFDKVLQSGFEPMGLQLDDYKEPFLVPLTEG